MKPLFTAILDLGFQSAVLVNRNYAAAAKASGKIAPLVIGLKRERGFTTFVTATSAC